MPACPDCGAVSPDGFRFCGTCGSRLDLKGCPACGAPHPDSQRFCGHCGLALLPAPPATPHVEHVHERKLATVLFADVVGFTSLSERTDLAEVAEEVGAVDSAVHGWSLLAIMARYSGRIRLAGTHAGVLARLLRPEQHEPWLGWAASFVVAVAEGATSAAPPFPPLTSRDPVAGLAGVVVRAELVLAGRTGEHLARPEVGSAKRPNSIDEAMGLVDAMALVLIGRGREAAPCAERAPNAARVLGARPTALAARALQAEIGGDASDLPGPAPGAASVAAGLVLRAHVALGNEAARGLLQRAAETLVAPGLLIGV